MGASMTGQGPPWWFRALAGAVAGLFAGALPSGVQLAQGSMSTGLVGIGLRLLLLVLVGVAIGLVVGYRPGGHAAAAGAGALLGLLWWALESLTIFPLLTGNRVTWSLVDARGTFPFLIGGLFSGGLTGFGVHLLGAAYARLKRDKNIVSVPKKRIVIIGGGFAGISVAQRLEHRLLRRHDVEVILVSASNYLLFTPMLAEVAAGALHGRHVSAAVRACCPQTPFYRAAVEAIDVAGQQVGLRPDGSGPARLLRYDQLVLALGATVNFRNLPGVAEHAYALKTLDDATRLRDHVIGLLERAEIEPDPAERGRQLTFAIAGGGFAGAELVAELYDMVHDLRRYYPRLDPGELRFVLIHSQDRILPELSPKLAAYALKKLAGKGIQFVLSARVTDATADSVGLSDGRRMPTRTLVWTAGNQPHPLVAALPLAQIRQGALVCDETMRVQGHPNVWALGDCAAIPDVRRPGEIHPPTAQHALRQGKTAADNVLATLDRKPAKPFRFRTVGLLVALGHQQGAAEIRGQRFSGLLAWMMWRGIYLGKLPGLEKKVRVALDWTLDLFFPRDVVLTQSQDSR